MADETADLVELLRRFYRSSSENPQTYLQPPSYLANETREVLKGVFDFSKKEEKKCLYTSGNLCPLEELIVDNFDDEQIWQEIELQNEPVLKKLRSNVRNLKKLSNSLTFLKQAIPDDNNKTSNEEDRLFSESEMEVGEKSDDDNLEGSGSNLESNQENFSSNDKEKKGKYSSEKTNGKSKQRRVRPKAKQSSVVDDKFFKLSEMEEFLNLEDRRFELAQRKKEKSDKDDEKDESDDSDESVDYFASLSNSSGDVGDRIVDDDDELSDDNADILGRIRKTQRPKKSVKDLKYEDYFDPPDGSGDDVHKTSLENDESESDDENEDDDDIEESMDTDEGASVESVEAKGDIEEQHEKNSNTEKLSSHEKKQLKIKQNIEKLEEENLKKKPWQLSGEAGSNTRPLNSLLEEDLAFDHTTVTAPEITEETTKSLEDIIKQRIKDTAWDDVERKQKPNMEPFEYKKRQPLDQEKSKLSLSQIYEQEYLKQTQAAEEVENEAHKEIKDMMAKLFTKLDALSNFHFTPKPPKPEVKVVTNAPSIAMEEVAPVAVSDAMLLAPEEIHEKKVELKGDTEKTETDRKRERRTKKLKQRQRGKDKEKRKKLVAKLNPGLGNVYSKKEALKKLEKGGERNVSLINDDKKERKALKSSSAFFSQLENQVKQTVKSKKEASSSKKKKAKVSTSHLKL